MVKFPQEQDLFCYTGWFRLEFSLQTSFCLSEMCRRQSARWFLRAWALPWGPDPHLPWPCHLVSGWTLSWGPDLREQARPCCCLECSRMSCVLVVGWVSFGNTFLEALASLWVCLEAAGMWLGVCPTRRTDAPLPANSWQPLLP